MKEFLPNNTFMLLAGSHPNYAADGGLCIMNLVSFMAGDRELTDHPECACPVLSAYAIGINDMLPDAERQRLLPFWPRLFGSRSAEHEAARLAVLVRYAVRMARIVLPIYENAYPGDDRPRKAIEAAESGVGCADAADNAARAAGAAAYVPNYAAHAATAAAHAHVAAHAATAAAHAAYVVNYAAHAAHAADVATYAAHAVHAAQTAYVAAPALRPQVFVLAIEALDEALKAGPEGVGYEGIDVARKVAEYAAEVEG